RASKQSRCSKRCVPRPPTGSSPIRFSPLLPSGWRAACRSMWRITCRSTARLKWESRPSRSCPPRSSSRNLTCGLSVPLRLLHLAGIAQAAARVGLPRPVRLSQVEHTSSAPVIVVDRVGILADLYALADVAFVGGGYHRAGLHSVLEPAVFGVPVAVGPHWHM